MRKRATHYNLITNTYYEVIDHKVSVLDFDHDVWHSSPITAEFVLSSAFILPMLRGNQCVN